MKICVAQIRPVKGDITANIEKHKKLIYLAVTNKADTIFFPELSVTGYEPGLAKDLAINPDDQRLDEFQEISNANKITIGPGVPKNFNTGVQISMVIFQPNKPRRTYSKQQLHSDELPYFVCGNKQVILTIVGQKVAPAICYESLQAEHSENAYRLGAEMYVASVAKSQTGIDKALKHFPDVAGKYSMPVLMSNCVGLCDNFESAGKSSIWNKKGNLVGQLNDTDEGILIFDSETGEITERII